MNNIISDFKDEVGEVAKDVVKIAKKQIASKPVDDNKIDQVTGKPPPKKKTLMDLQKATTQLAQMRLKKVREELEKQRLKVSEPKQNPQVGLEIKQEQPKAKEDIIQKTLKGSKSTGEFKGLIGG